MFKFLVALGTFSLVLASPLPNPTGDYNVGVKKFEIPVLNKNDPVWPNNISTECIATIFYPTLAKRDSKKRPYLDPVTTQLYNDVYQYVNVHPVLPHCSQKQVSYEHSLNDYPRHLDILCIIS